ncbi:MAG: hypothetical protein M1838_005771 [Thelocarpon superellum]|nr:MAG: hypothetical protein M1838_005771 [Thelocarpon superellum]
MPSQPLDDGPLACLITQNESKLCLPPGTYDLGRPMIYDFPYADVVKLALPHGGLADFGINGDVASFNESCNDSTIIDVVTMTSVPAEVGRANLTLQLPVDPPVACLFSEAHYRGAVKCFGLGALILPAAMLNQTASIWLHGGALAIGYGANGTRTAFSVLMSNPGNLNEMMTVSDLYLTELLVELLPTNGVCPNGYTIAQIGDA